MPKIDERKIKRFLDLIENRNLDELPEIDSLKLDEYFLNVFQRYELIGEIPLSEQNFYFICKLLQRKYYSKGKPNIEKVPPAIFCISLVFCARYSKVNSDIFWDPYAKRVWNTELSPTFQLRCRKYFKDCRNFLSENFNYYFPVINDGDLVRPVYFHAEIPYYLQSDFAVWIVDNYNQILEYTNSNLVEILPSISSNSVRSLRLRDFMIQENTRDVAVSLIQQMSKALKLYTEQTEFEEIESLIKSPIQKSIWVEITKTLQNSHKDDLIRKHQTQFYWVWNSKDETFCLRLTHIISPKNKKPSLLIWVDDNENNLIRQKVLQKVYPWQLENGDWELEPKNLDEFGSIDGRVIILSEGYDLKDNKSDQSNYIIFDQKIPTLSNDLIFIPNNRISNLSKPKESIENDGEWIILSKELFDVIKDDNEILVGENQLIPDILLQLGYRFAKKYSIILPINIRTSRGITSFESSKEKLFFQYSLVCEDNISGLSNNIPQIFTSPKIKLIFTGIKPEYKNLWLSIHKGNKFIQSLSFDTLIKEEILKQDNVFYEIDLHKILVANGSYSLRILYNLQSLSDDLIEFSMLSGLKIDGPDSETLYSPENPLKIYISGIDSSWIRTYEDDNVKKEEFDEKVILIWDEFEKSECRFSLKWEENKILFCWGINRVYAWADGEVVQKNIYEENIHSVKLHARGRPKMTVTWSIEGDENKRTEQLNMKGEYDEFLEKTVLYEIIKKNNLALSKVYIEIGGYSWNVFNYYKKPQISIQSVIYVNKKLSIEIQQDKVLYGKYVIQIISKSQNSLSIKVAEIPYLESKKDYGEFNLPKGKYQIEVFLNRELIAFSNDFESTGDKKAFIITPSSFTLIKNKSKFDKFELFTNLTILQSKIENELSEENYKTFIPPVQQMYINHTSSYWIANEKLSDGLKRLLPAWMVASHPILYQNKQFGTRFHIYPQQLAFGYKYGKGFLRTKIDQQNCKIYAAWNSDYQGKFANLWLMFPIGDELKKQDFGNLIETEMWPVYLCKNCGAIVGSRNGTYFKLPHNIILQHRHNMEIDLNEQFIDTVYGAHIKGFILSNTDEQLEYISQPQDIVGNNPWSLNIRVNNSELPKPIISNIDQYPFYCAISEVIENYAKNSTKIYLKKIISESFLYEKITAFFQNNKNDIPAFYAAERLINAIKINDARSKLPRFILLLCMILRLKGSMPEKYEKFIKETDISEEKLIELTYDSFLSCPKLVEWAIAFTDLFFIHTIS